jgi:hypothetical protein
MKRRSDRRVSAGLRLGYDEPGLRPALIPERLYRGGRLRAMSWPEDVLAPPGPRPGRRGLAARAGGWLFEDGGMGLVLLAGLLALGLMGAVLPGR